MLENWKKNVSNDELQIINSMTEEELHDAFYTKLEFGTAGMRGILGIGPNRMNLYQIKTVSIGYSKWLTNNFENASVVIAYDNRRQSKEFAELAATVFSSFGIKTFLASSLRPTPYLSYAVRELSASGGVMITASHNPKDNNGIKLYDEEGCQYTPSKIEPIIKLIKECDYFCSVNSKKEELISDYTTKLDKPYINAVKSVKMNEVKPIKTVFTPLHGTCSTLIKEILPEIIVVEEQMINDTEFSTVSSPNPENENVFEYAIKYGNKEDADLLIATDPDGDRIGVMVKHNKNYEYITGNELSVIILNYILENKKELNNSVVFKSIVTGTLGDKLCEKYGVEMRHNLTGFKYIGDGILKLKENEKFLFGYEESNGCLIKEFVRDKDSLQATYLLVEAASFYKEKNKTLLDVLEELYNTYGYHLNSTLSFEFKGETGALKMKKFVDFFRNNSIKNETEKLDFLKQSKYDLQDMIMVYTNYGSLIVRPSGTEPKIKVYVEIVLENRDLANTKLENIKEEINNIIRGL